MTIPETPGHAPTCPVPCCGPTGAPEVPEEAHEAVRSAIRTSLHTYANGDGDLTIYAEELPELVSDILSALPHLRVQETPGEVVEHSAEDQWYCPTSDSIECHHAGFDLCCDAPEKHVRLTFELVEKAVVAYHAAPRPVVDREALNRWIREEIERAIAFHAATKGSGHQAKDHCDGWTALSEAMQLMHDDAPILLKALSLLPTEEDTKGAGA